MPPINPLPDLSEHPRLHWMSRQTPTIPGYYWLYINVYEIVYVSVPENGIPVWNSISEHGEINGYSNIIDCSFWKPIEANPG